MYNTIGYHLAKHNFYIINEDTLTHALFLSRTRLRHTYTNLGAHERSLCPRFAVVVMLTMVRMLNLARGRGAPLVLVVGASEVVAEWKGVEEKHGRDKHLEADQQILDSLQEKTNTAGPKQERMRNEE